MQIKHLLNKRSRSWPLHVARDAGKGDRHVQTIVLLHGIATDSSTWDELIDKADGQNMRLVAIDLLGFGGSPAPVSCEYRPIDHIRSLRKTIRKLGLKNYVLVGHSMGGLLAADYAARYGRRVKGLIMLSPPIYSASDKTSARIATNVYMRLYEIIRKQPKLTMAVSNSLSKLWPSANGFRVNPGNWNAFTKSLKSVIETQNISQSIRDVSCPVEVIYGSLDQFIVGANLEPLSALGVKVTRVRKADHLVGARLTDTLLEHLRSKDWSG